MRPCTTTVRSTIYTLSRELSGISSRHDEAAATTISGGMGLSESTEFRACMQARAT